LEYFKFINVTSFYNEKAEFEKLESTVRKAVDQIDLPYELEIEINHDEFEEEDLIEAEANFASVIYVNFDLDASYDVCSFVLDVIKELIEEEGLSACYDLVTNVPNFESEF
jgi:hypothetical protein